MTAGQRYLVSLSSVCSLFLKLFTTMSDPGEQMAASPSLRFLLHVYRHLLMHVHMFTCVCVYVRVVFVFYHLFTVFFFFYSFTLLELKTNAAVQHYSGSRSFYYKLYKLFLLSEFISRAKKIYRFSFHVLICLV